ncbi:Mg-chelatase subunit ChlI-like protein [Nostoc sp. NIES-4103]|nr:Mg-chelatase subunit ChlI-like protein [Nostoc sp. NIES-4103]
MTELAKSQLSLTDSFTRSLACAAITPGLRSILLFDSSFEVLQLAAQIIAEMLEVVVGDTVKAVYLNSFESEENLWGSWQLSAQSEKQLLQWKPGLLANDSELRLVIIPDLTKLSLAAARACVVLMGTDVAHLQRHGQQTQWQPNICWLAGCGTGEVGMVSPHLLDRFALRLKAEVRKTKDRAKEILELIDEQESAKANKPELILPIEIEDKLKKALRHHPQISPKAIARILNYTPQLEEIYPRREIALARLSLANVRLEGADEMSANDVDIAARMIGLSPISEPIKETPNPIPEPVREPAPRKQERLPEIPNLKVTATTEKISELVYQPTQSEFIAPTPLNLTSNLENLYPEDTAAVERDVDSLRLPTRRFRSKAVPRGSIIGVEKAKTLQDIALVPTLIEAAKYQPIRCKDKTASQKPLLQLSPTDFYSYRRSPVAEQMLMLLIDYTCLQDCDWQEELLPYLSWAYVERASVCLIQVGAANASNFLQAERIMAHSILVPRINAGLEAGRGKATPLAHGLQLGLQTLRHALQHGRSTVDEAVLVVISDGRGNVPLDGCIKPPVGRKGVEDALLVAESIGNLDKVKTVLLNPQPEQYRDLPLELAEKMGASVFDIPPLRIVEEE